MYSRLLSNTTDKPAFQMTESIVVAYYPLFLMTFGALLNIFTLIILCRGSFRDTKKQPTIHYMRATTVFDILMLYGWNFQHYLTAVYGYNLERYSIPSCKFYLIFSYFNAQASAWLRVFVCLDRFLSLNYLHKTWFSHPKNVLIVIACLLSFLVLFNLHLAILGCSYNSSGIVDFNTSSYQIFPLWDYINLAVYNCIPFVFMIVFNSGVIYQLIRLRRTRTIQNSRIQHRSLSITSLFNTFLFLIMTIPASIAFGFFYNIASASVLRSVDACLFTYHITPFPLYMITYKKFRRECLNIILCRKNHPRIEPTATMRPPLTVAVPVVIKFKTTAKIVRQIS